MDDWNVVLQFAGPTWSDGTCRRYSVAGIPRPCRILIYACDSGSKQTAHAALFTDRSGNSTFGRVTLRRTVLDPVAGVAKHGRRRVASRCWFRSSVRLVSRQVHETIACWQKKAGSDGSVVPALVPTQSHATAFAGCSPAVANLTTVAWSGNPDVLAAAVLQRAMHDSQPGLFVSYRRVEAGVLVDQLFDELSRNGFRVFLDRFSGTPGRYFPQELAEEMADKAVLLVIETPSILQSKWTLWEVCFARQYGLGLVFLRFPGAPKLSNIGKRMDVSPHIAQGLDAAELTAAVDFIKREWIFAAARRRAFYEGVVAGAASVRGGTVKNQCNGLLALCNSNGKKTAIVSPSARPGRLRDLRELAVPVGAAEPRLLLGQHCHLPQQSYDDISWLAQKISVELHGHYSGYQRIKSLC